MHFAVCGAVIKHDLFSVIARASAFALRATVDKSGQSSHPDDSVKSYPTIVPGVLDAPLARGMTPLA
jgi:hypothetical protein